MIKDILYIELKQTREDSLRHISYIEIEERIHTKKRLSIIYYLSYKMRLIYQLLLLVYLLSEIRISRHI